VARILLVSVVVVAVGLVVGAGAPPADSARAMPPDQEVEQAQGTVVPYAGLLSDAAGQPVADGLYVFSFALYAAEAGGAPLWSEVQEQVAVMDGTFEVALGSAKAIEAAALDGGGRWLAVGVQGPGESDLTPLLPRQLVTATSPAAPEAVTQSGACPHDHVGDVWTASIPWSGGALKILNYSNGPTIWGWNGGGGNAIRGYASGAGLGVYGESVDAAGVRGRSTNGHGVEGFTTVAGSYGVYGKNENTAGAGIGVVGYGPKGIGVLGQGSNYGVYSKGNLYVEGNLYATGSKGGYVVDVAQNDDVSTMEPGDLVAISGAGPAVLGEIPVIKVRRATSAQPGAIVGVVDQHFALAPEGAAAEDMAMVSAVSAVIGPGDYLTVVTLGAYKALKVDASYGAISPGDLLVASTNPGHAMRADSPAAGTILGKALGEWTTGVGIIPVMVTLQ
jgi:hypothetical protein